MAAREDEAEALIFEQLLAAAVFVLHIAHEAGQGAPFDRRMIEVSMLTETERSWLDTYLVRVLADVGPRLDAAERNWLASACAPLNVS